MIKAKPSGPHKAKSKTTSSPDTLAKASKKASATLNEAELKKVSGGMKIGPLH